MSIIPFKAIRVGYISSDLNLCSNCTSTKYRNFWCFLWNFTCRHVWITSDFSQTKFVLSLFVNYKTVKVLITMGKVGFENSVIIGDIVSMFTHFMMSFAKKESRILLCNRISRNNIHLRFSFFRLILRIFLWQLLKFFVLSWNQNKFGTEKCPKRIQDDNTKIY